jgi:hypothetical protein
MLQIVVYRGDVSGRRGDKGLLTQGGDVYWCWLPAVELVVGERTPGSTRYELGILDVH